MSGLCACEIAPNEWVTSDNINNCFAKLNANLDYLTDKSQVYNTPPTEFYGWLGTLVESNSVPVFRWRVNQQYISYGYDMPNSYICWLVR